MKHHLSVEVYVLLAAVFAVVLLTDATITVRDTDITTRGKTFRVVCFVQDESFVGWYSKNGRVNTVIVGDQLTNSRLYVLKNSHVHSSGDEYTLIIQNVKVADGGMYQCRGSKQTKNFTLFVEFYSIDFPTSQELDAGKNRTLKCAADGYPYPTFKWYKNFKRIDLSNPRYTIVTNGSLALTNVHEDDAGNYTCLITQLGEIERQREERKDIEVTVFAPPRIDVSLSTKVVYSYIGNPRRLQFQCYFWGYPIPQMKITKNDKLLSNNNVDKEGERSIIGFLRTEKESDFGPYTCEAENDRGKASYDVEIKPAGRPTPPQNLTAKRECDHVTVSWSKPEDDGGIPVIHYTLELEQDSRMLHTVIVGPLTMRYTFTRGIRPKTVYELRIKARSEAQNGQWANSTVVSGVCPPRGQMFITNKETQLNSTSFTLKWTKPEDGGDPNLTYTVEYSKRDTDGNFVHWNKWKDIQQQEYNISELEDGAEYEFRVTAVNSAGQSDEQAVKTFLVLAGGAVQPTPGGLDMIYDIKINCTSPNIYLNFNVKDYAGFDKESFHLRDSSCVPYQRSATNVLLKTALDACGTTNKHNNETVTYYNSIVVKVSGIQETDRIEFPFSCTFGKENTIGIPSFQTRQRVMVYQVGFGNFTFLMNLYKDKKYEIPYQVSEYPVTVHPSSTLYCQAELKASDAQLVMLPTTCTATPSMNPDDPIRYPFIQSGCPADDFVTYTYQHSSVQRFQLVAFRFKQESKFVYLHCEVLVCHKANYSRCTQGCQGTKRRSVGTDFNTHSVTLGPIQLERKSKVSKKTKNQEFKGSLSLLLLAIFGTAIGVAGFFVAVIYILHKTVMSSDTKPHPQNV